MKWRLMLAAGIISLVASLSGTTQAEEPKIPEGFTPLFDGKGLSGWKVFGGKMEVWGVEKGLIYVEKGGGGWLMTEKEYGDYELKLEYKLSKGANSGVALRAPLEGNPAYQGMELQLIDDEGWPGKLQPWQHTASIYDVVPASKTNNKPIGEWNTMRIVAKGPKITIEVNGATVVDADLEKYKESKSKAHPGILRTKGHIGLQSYNTRVEFRNIWVKPIS